MSGENAYLCGMYVTSFLFVYIFVSLKFCWVNGLQENATMCEKIRIVALTLLKRKPVATSRWSCAKLSFAIKSQKDSLNLTKSLSNRRETMELTVDLSSMSTFHEGMSPRISPKLIKTHIYVRMCVVTRAYVRSRSIQSCSIERELSSSVHFLPTHLSLFLRYSVPPPTVPSPGQPCNRTVNCGREFTVHGWLCARSNDQGIDLF